MDKPPYQSNLSTDKTDTGVVWLFATRGAQVSRYDFLSSKREASMPGTPLVHFTSFWQARYLRQHPLKHLRRRLAVVVAESELINVSLQVLARD